jgi:spermidine synthase
LPLASNSGEQWFGERERVGLEQRIQVRGVLYEGRSEYQSICVLDTVPFGRALILDNILQTTEKDEFIYHEMMVHPTLISLTRPERVLIIGGGDGGSLRRVLEHSPSEVVQVELDRAVVETCRRYLPQVSSGAFDDPRLDLLFADGYEFVEKAQEPFDAIIVDLTDPFPPGPSLRRPPHTEGGGADRNPEQLRPPPNGRAAEHLRQPEGRLPPGARLSRSCALLSRRAVELHPGLCGQRSPRPR